MNSFEVHVQCAGEDTESEVQLCSQGPLASRWQSRAQMKSDLSLGPQPVRIFQDVCLIRIVSLYYNS